MVKKSTWRKQSRSIRGMRLRQHRRKKISCMYSARRIPETVPEDGRRQAGRPAGGAKAPQNAKPMQVQNGRPAPGSKLAVKPVTKPAVKPVAETAGRSSQSLQR